MDLSNGGMFGRFHVQPSPPPPTAAAASEESPGHRARSLSSGDRAKPQAHACLECRRRKSKCDGARPCSRCKAKRKEALCVYVGQKKRIIPSQRTVDELANSLQECRNILNLLFPSTPQARLQDLTREGLVSLAVDQSLVAANPGQHHAVSLPAARVAPALPNEHNDVLEQMHNDEEHSEYDEQEPDYVTSDVNALDLTKTGTSSYVGSSSVSAALRVIAASCPSVIKQPSLYAPSPASSGTMKSQEHDLTAHASVKIPRPDELSFMNAYFEHVHPTVPMINETRFRHDYTTGLKENPSWLGLVNMVLCMGSIAGQTAQHQTHLTYYQRARKHLTFDSFGSGRIETIQALALMGGMYFHYCNQPNMALSIMGAALRMSYALGLHRLVSPGPQDGAEAASQRRRSNADYDTKLRTWWCIVCLDVWGSTTLGRPMSDYFGPSTLSPRFPSLDTPSPSRDRPILLAADTRFCEISARIQERLTIASCLCTAEIEAFDSELEAYWETEVPPLLKASSTTASFACPRALLVPRAILKWRYQNARYLLRRPVLLSAALLRRAPADLSPHDRRSIALCRHFAKATIYDIAAEWAPNHFCGWHAAWNLFQAAFIPLVSLFYEARDEAACADWRAQVELSLGVFERLELWSLGGRRTRQVLRELLDASGRISSFSFGSGSESGGAGNGNGHGSGNGMGVGDWVCEWNATQMEMQQFWADNVLDAPPYDGGASSVSASAGSHGPV